MRGPVSNWEQYQQDWFS